MTDDSVDASPDHGHDKPVSVWLAQAYVALLLLVTSVISASFLYNLILRGGSAAPLAQGVRIPFMLGFLIATLYALQGRRRWSYAFSVGSLGLIACLWLWALLLAPTTPDPAYLSQVRTDLSPEEQGGVGFGVALLAPFFVLPAYVALAPAPRRYFRVRSRTARPNSRRANAV